MTRSPGYVYRTIGSLKSGFDDELDLLHSGHGYTKPGRGPHPLRPALRKSAGVRERLYEQLKIRFARLHMR